MGLSTSKEREFFRLAANWLACRHEVMWGSRDTRDPHFDIRFALLGMNDYELEMKLMIAAITGVFKP